jgi:hypothetical protein
VNNKPVEILVRRGRVIKEKMQGVSLIKIYCKHLCKCHNETLYNYNMLIIKISKNKHFKNGNWSEKDIEIPSQHRTANEENKECQVFVRVQGKRNSDALLGNYELELLLWKSVWRLLKKTKRELTYDPTLLLLGIYTKNVSLHPIKTPAYPCLYQHRS